MPDKVGIGDITLSNRKNICLLKLSILNQIFYNIFNKRSKCQNDTYSKARK